MLNLLKGKRDVLKNVSFPFYFFAYVETSTFPFKSFIAFRIKRFFQIF